MVTNYRETNTNKYITFFWFVSLINSYSKAGETEDASEQC
jgi:hypothetical protein